MKNVTLLLLLAALLLLSCLPLAIANPVPPTSISTGASERRDLGTLANLSTQAQGGNITALDVEIFSITESWQGYYGNVTGKLILDDADNNTFYDWNITGSVLEGEVYASRNDTIIWSSINCTNATERLDEMAYLGQQLADGDSIVNTYNKTSHPSFMAGPVNITVNSCFSGNAQIDTGVSPTDYYQILLSDNQSSLIYTTIIDSGQLGFDGEQHDFELMVGENEKAGNEGPTPYYFWVELG